MGPRKQRTRQHIIAALSVNHVERFILEVGFTAQQLQEDYGYDLHVLTYDAQGYIEPGSIYLQLKASESLQVVGSSYVFDLDIRDYNLWIQEPMPVILILYDAGRRKAYWIHIQAYFARHPSRSPGKDAKTVRVHVPKRQAVTAPAVRRMRDIKQALV